MHKRWLPGVAFAVTLALVLWFRFFVVRTWHAPAGDGVDFYQLSQSLQLTGRFAYGPPPLGPSYGRLPGYPLFLAYVAVRQAPLDLLGHVVRATQANVPISLATALLLFLTLRELGFGRRSAVIGLLLTLLYPLLVLLGCYALTETLATFLGLAGFYAALRLRRAFSVAPRFAGWGIWALAGGVAMGLGQLVRADTITLIPPLAVLICAPLAGEPAAQAKSSWQGLARRGLPFLLLLAVAGLVFLPWPLRNLRQFGQAHAAAARWRTRPAGNPLPSEPVAWMRTWGDGAASDGYYDLVFVAGLRLPLDAARFPQKTCEGQAQCDRTRALFQRYNQEGLSATVRQEFAALASERAAAAPLRTWIGLPLLRTASLWRPLPEWELPLRAPALGLPRHRYVFAVADLVLYGLALIGAGLLLWAGRSRTLPDAIPTLGALALPAILRSAMYAYLIPAGINQRYLVEIVPFLIILSLFGARLVAERMRRSV